MNQNSKILISVISDDTSINQRHDLIVFLQETGLEVTDMGYLPVRGSRHGEIEAALTSRFDNIRRNKQSNELIAAVSHTGTSFSMYINKIPNETCVAQFQDSDLVEVRSLGATAIEISVDSDPKLVAELLVEFILGQFPGFNAIE